MLSRLFRALRAGAGRGTRVARAFGAAFDKEDVLTLIGLGMLAGGLWQISHAASIAVPGVILLWMFVPPRPPFIERPATRARRIPE